MSSTDSVVVTTVVAVEPATAFEVFTDEIDTWWKRGPRYRFSLDGDGVMRFEPGVGGRLLEDYDGPTGDVFEVGQVLVWEPPDRLVFEFRSRTFEPDDQTEVEVRFERVDEGTLVTLEHRGWDSFASDHPIRHDLVGAAFTDMIGGWWAEQLVEVRAHAARTVP